MKLVTDMHRKTILRLVSAAIAIATLISVLSLTARASAEHLYDYSRPGSQHTVTLNSADILERILSTPLPEAERNYLVAYGDT